MMTKLEIRILDDLWRDRDIKPNPKISKRAIDYSIYEREIELLKLKGIG